VLSSRSGITSAILRSSGIDPRIVGTLTPFCSDLNANVPCQAVAGGLDIGSLTGGLGQYVSLSNLGGGGLDGIPDIQRVITAEPRTNKPNQYNLRLDFNPTSNDQIT